jgi:uncharacterized protein (TIGR03435 family)
MGRTRLMTAKNAPIRQLLTTLIGELHRPLQDQTGLTGKSDWQVEWNQDLVRASADSNNTSAAADLFTAVQEQLGLKLEPIKTSIDVIVIDHAEKPDAN